MVDMSYYEKTENLARTAKLVIYCHERGIATEAEPGRIEGGEDGVMDTAGLEASKTTLAEVKEFKDTSVDCLAPAIGNVLGEYGANGPQLDLDRLNKIRTTVAGQLHIALHGTNGFHPDLMSRCIAAGATKINVNKLSLSGYYEHLENNVGKLAHTVLIEEGAEEVTRQTVEWMEVCGSVGKA